MRLLEKTEVRKPTPEDSPPSPNGHPEVEAALPGEAAVARAARAFARRACARLLRVCGRSSARRSSPLSPTSTRAISPPTSPPARSSATCCSGWWSRANLIAMLIQTQSAKLGIATGKNLPELCRETFSRRTLDRPVGAGRGRGDGDDIAEVVGAALGLNLLFGIPLFPAALIAGAGAFAILALQQRGFRRLEAAIAALAGVVLVCFGFEIFWAKPTPATSPGTVRARLRRHREHPAGHRDHRRDGDAARRLPALGADPEARRRAQRRRAPPDPAVREGRRGDRDGDRRGRQPVDDGDGGGAVPRRRPDRDRQHRGRLRGPADAVSDNAATVFGIALLASGFASSSVGTMSGPGRDAGVHPPPDPDLPAPRDHPRAGADRARARGRSHQRAGDQPGGALVRDPVRAHPAAADRPPARGHGGARQPAAG